MFKGTAMMLSRKGGLKFVARTPTVGTDFSLPFFTWDGTWHNLDMSAIVPIKAKAVLVEVGLCWNQVGNQVFLRHPDDTNANGAIQFRQTLVSQRHYRTVLMPVKNATISYKTWNGTGQYFNWVILGWFV